MPGIIDPSPRQLKKLVKLLNKLYPGKEIIDFTFTYRTYGEEAEDPEDPADVIE